WPAAEPWVALPWLVLRLRLRRGRQESQDFIAEKLPELLDHSDFDLFEGQASDGDLAVKPEIDPAIRLDQALPGDRPAGQRLEHLDQEQIRGIDDIGQINHGPFMRRWVVWYRGQPKRLEVVRGEHLADRRIAFVVGGRCERRGRRLLCL